MGSRLDPEAGHHEIRHTLISKLEGAIIVAIGLHPMSCQSLSYILEIPYSPCLIVLCNGRASAPKPLFSTRELNQFESTPMPGELAAEPRPSPVSTKTTI